MSALNITQLIIGGLGSISAYLMARVVSEVSALRKSAEQLNINIAIIVTRINGQERRISLLEDENVEHYPNYRRP